MKGSFKQRLGAMLGTPPIDPAQKVRQLTDLVNGLSDTDLRNMARRPTSRQEILKTLRTIQDQIDYVEPLIAELKRIQSRLAEASSTAGDLLL